ncbi:acyltransferase domain-containing protein [Streptomyces sp. Go40/10]|uniref:acyltransferase domain-containing protein n=1 Tax=Streptomyces sp. Go40/10 TaxID=2825844 RepID=UPI001E5E65A0|nr:acyltransferase domain-containing protein [Streptomyces sp. Go40/10]UFR01379.1 acyltransferase domain-containing protein [Streptomyces sp. Go40/10]
MTPSQCRSVVLMLPGTGAQHPRMALGLWRRQPVFTEAVEAVLDRLGPEGEAIRADWLADEPRVPLDADSRAAPLLFAVDYAMGRLVQSWGVRPAAYLGHSMGELAAAVLTGVFGLDAAVRLLWERVRMQRSTPVGGMLAVAAGPQELSGYLGGDLVVGAVNGPRHTVLSGPEHLLRAAEHALRADGRTFRRLGTHTPYHSPALAPLVADTVDLVARLRPAVPRAPLYSAYTAGPLRAHEAVDPHFWAVQPTRPVMFWRTLDRVLRDGDRLLVETGPAQTLTVLARAHPAVRAGRSAVVPTLPPRAAGPDADRRCVEAARAALADGGHLTARRTFEAALSPPGDARTRHGEDGGLPRTGRSGRGTRHT